MELKLYHKWMCPYSAKVRDFIEENNLREQVDYVDRDENEENKKKLKELTGKTQVPCLVIDGKPMHESDEIISWLKENLSGKENESDEVAQGAGVVHGKKVASLDVLHRRDVQ